MSRIPAWLLWFVSWVGILAYFVIYRIGFWFLTSLGTKELLDLLGLSDLGFPVYVLIGVVLTLFINLLLYGSLLSAEYPHLQRRLIADIAEAAGDKVWNWQTQIMGHKLWAGKKTYSLLSHLMDPNTGVGRARWLLPNFLQFDIERKFEPHSNPVLYEVAAQNWSLKNYSDFLAANMTHAEHSICWVVDPSDFLIEILPLHIVEVILSIGSVLDSTLQERIRDLQQDANSNNPTRLRAELGEEYAPHCYFRAVNNCSVISTVCSEGVCPKSFKFDESARDNQLGHFKYAFFVGATKRLSGYEISADIIRHELRIGDNTITFQNILGSYNARVKAGYQPWLPHIESFQSAPCRKKRHVFLGLRGDSRSEASTTKAVSYISGIFEGDFHDYIGAVCPTAVEAGSPQFVNSWIAHDRSATGKISLHNNRLDLWHNITLDVKRLILRWSLQLFAHTSGDEDTRRGILNGVFVHEMPGPEMMKYADSFDIGIYDDRFVVFSDRSSMRNVTWRFFNAIPELTKTFFPSEERYLLNGAALLESVEAAIYPPNMQHPNTGD